MLCEMYKLHTNGKLEAYGGQAVVMNGMVHSNPSVEMLYKCGYLPMGAPVIPEHDPETQFVMVDHYDLSSDKTEIIAVYTVQALELSELETETEEELDFEMRLTALEQENAWLREALDMLLEGAIEDEPVEE